jgi:protein gp37
MSKRNPAVLGEWGPEGKRAHASQAYWHQPFAWDLAAEAAGERRRVFCASLADVFEDRPELVEPRARLFDVIGATPHLDWLLLTKRPENIIRLWPNGYRLQNAWLGTSAEDQKTLKRRAWALLQTPATVRFLSLEPLLGPVDTEEPELLCDAWRRGGTIGTYLDWVIVGGESGPKARPCDVAWIRRVVEQCRETKTACFVKQLGANPGTVCVDGTWVDWRRLDVNPIRDRAGADPSEWPEGLRVREFPEVPHA